MEIVQVCGESFEVIELFEYHVLVQDPETLAIFLIEYQSVDPEAKVKYTITDSNLFSLKGYSRWPKLPRNTKQK